MIPAAQSLFRQTLLGDELDADGPFVRTESLGAPQQLLDRRPTLFAGRNRLYLSRDGGRFWEPLSVELPDIEAVELES